MAAQPIERQYAYDPDLKCSWRKWVMKGPGCLALYVPELQCADMTGAIRVGMRLLPTVQEITVISGDEIDIVYRRDGAGWFSDSGRWNGRRVVVEQEQLCEHNPH